jgi:hypothetical protein
MPQANLPWTSGLQLQEAPPKGGSSETEPDIRPKRRVWVCRGLFGFLTALVLFAAVLSHHARRALAALFLVIMFIGQAVEQAEVAKAPDTHSLGLRHAGGLLREHGGGAAWLAGPWMGGAWRLGRRARHVRTATREQKIILKCDPCRWKKTRC